MSKAKARPLGSNGRSSAASFLGQRVLDGLLSRLDAQKLRRKLLSAARKALIHSLDPIVSYRIEGQYLRLPLSHDLPLIRKEHPYYLANLTRVSDRIFEKYPEATAIDIGANVGDTAVLIRCVASIPILCIEGDPLFARLLYNNLLAMEDIEIEEVFVDARTGIRLTERVSEKGTTRILVSERNGVPIEFTTLSQILARHRRFQDPALVKLDTDGWDCAIISSEEAFFAKARPAVFFEYEPETKEGFPPPGQALVRLHNAGYTVAIVYSNTGTFMRSISMGGPVVEEIARLCRRSPGGYCDVVAFHERDEDIVELLLRYEDAVNGDR